MYLSITDVVNDSHIPIPTHIAGYNLCYSEFIEYFKSNHILNRHSFIIGANFTYAWMPRILKLKAKYIDSAVEIINEIRKGAELTVNDYQIIKNCINGSIVGTSKLLHFIYPQKYPIWDSHVCRYLSSKNEIPFNPDAIKDYINYRELVLTLTESDQYTQVHQRIQNQFQYEISKIRSIELVFFVNGRNLKKKTET